MHNAANFTSPLCTYTLINFTGRFMPTMLDGKKQNDDDKLRVTILNEVSFKCKVHIVEW
jgi:hypothetical protein